MLNTLLFVCTSIPVTTATLMPGLHQVDLEKEELADTLDALVAARPDAVSTGETPEDYRVSVAGINASYDQLKPNLGSEAGLFPAKAPKSFWWLGSSIGNEDFEGAVNFLKSFSDKLIPGDTFLIGIDSTNIGSDVELAYGDRHHTTESFILNGMDAASRLLEKAGYTNTKSFSSNAFEYVHRYNAEGGCHEVGIIVFLASADNSYADLIIGLCPLERGHLVQRPLRRLPYPPRRTLAH